MEAAPDIDWQSMIELFIMSWAVGCTAILDGIAQRTRSAPGADKVEPLTWALYQMGRQENASAHVLAIQHFQAIGRKVARFFTEYDVWLTSVLAEPPVRLGAFSGTPEDPLRGLYPAAEFSPFTPLANITGQPAMSVPLYWNTEGLPIGAHFMARFGDEATLFRLAAELERARPRAARIPAMALR